MSEIMEKQREADERLQIMLDANPHSNVLFNDRFDVIDCNPIAVKYMGFKTKEELLDGFVGRMNKSIPAFQPDGRPSFMLTDRLMAAAKDGYVKFETELIMGGEPRTLNIELKRIPYQNSFAVVAYVFDMTEIHAREMELKRAHELNELQLAKLNLAVQATKIGLWDMEVVKRDKTGSKNIFTWSDEFRQMLGFSNAADFPNELNCWSDRLHPEDKNRTFDSFNKHLLDKTGKTLFDVEYRLQKKNGEYAHFHDSCKTIRDEDGNPIRVAGALVDITETKNIILDKEKMRIEAEAASKAKSAFLSTMSHEIRTPMNAILGITEIQMQNETLNQDAKEAFNKIRASGDMLLGIINDILDLSKIEAGKMELVIARYEIASLISDTAQLNMMRIGSKPIEFELDVDEKTPLYLLGDELRVKQILNNILSNAFKYTASGAVRLSLSAEAGDGNNADDTVTLIFKVSDTGQGMTKEQIDRLFDEYSRFNLEANRSTEGTGLGMSITQKLIHMMNGEITIESEPGGGTTFTVRLPQRRIGHEVLGRESVENLHLFRSSSRAQMKRTQIAREPMPYGSVLVVDDVETNIYVARGLLAPYELKVDSAESGFAAIEKIKNGREYDIVFMDHMMPKMDGIEATKIIRDMGYKHPVVALTANAVSGQADIFLCNGFDDYISKPIDVRQLNAVLNKLIRDKQPPEIVEEARRQVGEKKEPLSISDDAPAQEIDPRFSEVFLRDASRSLAVLDSIQERRNAYSEEDIRTYVIHAHGIKSALANIGKMELSAVALKLEMSARDADTAVMASETTVFLDSLRALVEELKSAKEKVHIKTEDEDRPYLREKLSAIKTTCESYDKKTARDVLAQLKDKTWSRPTEEMLDAISEYLLHSDFDEIAAAANKYLQEN